MSKMVTTRGISRPPQELKVLIGVANKPELLPAAKELFAEPGKQARISRLLKSFTAEERAFLGSPRDEFRFRRQYDAFISAKNYLPLLADRREAERGDYEIHAQFTSLPSLDTNLYVENGLFSSSGVFTNALNQVPADHLRRCAECPNVFWAPRTNSECCCVRHRKAWNKRNSRKNREAQSKAKINKMGSKSK